MPLLFKKDWSKYPTAIVDYNTTNESFLRLVYTYKKMGIDNCEFPLALHQPELVGVDPFAEDLDDEMKFKISLEARYNPWYYFREISRLPPNAGTEPIRFRINRAIMAAYWSFFNHVDFGLLMPRQTGKSAGVDVLMVGLKNIWASRTRIQLITKDTALRVANIERIKEIRDLLPDYIYTPNRLDADNSEVVTNVQLKNRYQTAVGRNDRVAADKLGRGLTVPIVHFDELAYISMIGASLPVALSSGSAARDEARAAGQPYGNIYTTTAGDRTSRDGRYAYEFLTGGIPWSEHFLDLPDQEALVKVVEKAARSGKGTKPLIYGAFNHRQLGKTDDWLYRKLRESAAHGELADRDYMNIWTTGSAESPLSSEEKDKILKSEREIQHMEFFSNGYSIRWYIPAHEIATRLSESRFVLGADPSETLGDKNDATALLLLDAYTHDVVATTRITEGNTTHISGFITDLLVKYPNVTFIPERRSMGSAILDNLFIMLPNHGIDPFKRIFNRIVDEPETYESEYAVIRKPLSSRPTYFYDRYKRYFGFATSGSGRFSRDALYIDCLKPAIAVGGDRMYDRALINEILSLTVRNGRIDHSNGNHDDLVVSLLLTHWFCTKAKNLSYYGIDATKIFSKATKEESSLSPVEQYQHAKKQRVRDEFNELVEQLKEAKDPMEISKLEMRIRQISREYDFTETMGVGIDAMIRQAQEERVRKSRMARFSGHRTWMSRAG